MVKAFKGERLMVKGERPIASIRKRRFIFRISNLGFMISNFKFRIYDLLFLRMIQMMTGAPKRAETVEIGRG